MMLLIQAIEILNTHVHLIWTNVFFYFFIASLVFTGIIMFVYNRRMHMKTTELKLMQQQHTAKIDNVRKEQSETLEKLRVEMLKREEERTRQWMESEKETLHVLNGVSNLLDLSEKLDKSESEKIIKKLDEIYEKVSKIPTT